MFSKVERGEVKILFFKAPLKFYPCSRQTHRDTQRYLRWQGWSEGL